MNDGSGCFDLVFGERHLAGYVAKGLDVAGRRACPKPDR